MYPTEGFVDRRLFEDYVGEDFAVGRNDRGTRIICRIGTVTLSVMKE